MERKVGENYFFLRIFFFFFSSFWIVVYCVWNRELHARVRPTSNATSEGRNICSIDGL